MDTVVDEHLVVRPGRRLRSVVPQVSGWQQAGVAPDVHQGLPSPWLTVIVTLHDPLVVASHPDPGQPAGEYQALVAGLHTTPAVVTHAGRQSGVQLAIHPLAARALLGVPAGELAGRDEHAADVVGTWADQVQDRVRSAPGWAARFAVVESELAARLGTTEPAPELRRAWVLLVGGRGTVAEVADDVGWSPRRLHARCRAELGLSPQELRRVARFDRARRAVAAGRPLATVAVEEGYTDQAHLSRDFTRFAGLPPGRWSSAQRRSVQDPATARPAGSAA